MPRGLVEDEAFQAPNVTVCTPYLVPLQVRDTAEMQISLSMHRVLNAGGHGGRHGRLPVHPVGQAAKVFPHGDFLLARYRLFRINVGTLSYLLLRQGNVKGLFLPIKPLNSRDWEDHLSSREPAAHVDDQIVNNPGLVVEKKVLYGPGFSIGCNYAMINQC